MKKVLSLLLAVMMVITMLPVAAFADELELFPMGEAAEEEALAAEPEKFIEIIEPAPRASEELISVQSDETEKTTGIPGYFNVTYTSAGTGTVETVGTCEKDGKTGKVYLITLPEDAVIKGTVDSCKFSAYQWNAVKGDVKKVSNSALPDPNTYMKDEQFAKNDGNLKFSIHNPTTWNEGFTLPTSGVKGFCLFINGKPTAEEYTIVFVQIPYHEVVAPENPMSGAGTEEDPYIIKESTDLKYMSEYVNGNFGYFEDTYFKIADDVESITLPDDWEPIGKAKLIIKEGDWVMTEVYRFPFCGHIDGNNKLLIVPNGSLSLIGVPGSWASVKNLNIYGEKIPGYGLVENYMVSCTMTIDNVTIKSGSHILKSGLIGGYGNTSVNISNCTVEKGVVIGDDGTWGDLGDTTELYNFYGYINHQDMIGSLCGAWNGNIINCKSYATVYGRNYVGGLVGFKGQSMRELYIYDSAFYGDVIATGEGVGGIMGSGYVAYSAPNTPCANIQNCYATGNIIGADKVGGIFGGELGIVLCWSNGIGYVRNNYFSGTVKATKEDAFVGGVVGYMNGLNLFTIIDGNYYINSCGATKAVGGGGEFITTNEKYDLKATEKRNHSFTEAQLTNGELVTLLNSGKKAGRTDWQQGSGFPVHGNEKHITNLYFTDTRIQQITSVQEINEYARDNDIKMTVEYSDGTSEVISAIEGVFGNVDYSFWFETQLASFTYKNYEYCFDLNVIKAATGNMKVKVQVLGDSRHGDDGSVHTYKDGSLTEWLPMTEFEVPNNYNLFEVFYKTVSELENSFVISYKNKVNVVSLDGGQFISYVDYYYDNNTVNYTRLDATCNGANSCWQFEVNGINATSTYLKDIYLEDGDTIVLYYTDDYTQESPAANYNDVMKVRNLINDIGKVTIDSGAAITVARKAYDALDEASKTYIDNYETLTKAEAAYKKLINKAPTRPDEPVHIVIGAATNAAAKGEENPNTGAPVI